MDFSNAYSQDFAALAAAPPDPTYGDARNLLTLAKVKEILGIASSTEDAKLTAAMPVVTDLFENYCQRGLAYDREELEEHYVTQRIPLFRYPLATIDLFMLDGVEQETPKMDKRHGFVLYGSNAPDSTASITYAGGYPQADVPRDLADAYARCCADYSGVAYTSGGSTGGSAPLKSLSLGSGALAVSFDTGSSAASSTYDTSAVPSLLQPYYFVLERYRVKDYV